MTGKPGRSGRPRGERTACLTLRFRPDMLDAVRREAARRGYTVTLFLERTIERALPKPGRDGA